MSAAPLVIVGAGGHGREIATLAQALGRGIAGVVSADPPDLSALKRLGVAWLGGDESIAALDVDAEVVLGVGYPWIREPLCERLETTGCRFTAALVHPLANVGSDVHLGEGCVVQAGVHLTTNVTVGRHSHLGVGSIISHDGRVGDFVTLGPGVTLSGDVSVGDGVFVGVGAVVMPGCTLGDGAVVGAGAVVVGDVPAGATAKGVPARW